MPKDEDKSRHRGIQELKVIIESSSDLSAVLDCLTQRLTITAIAFLIVFHRGYFLP